MNRHLKLLSRFAAVGGALLTAWACADSPEAIDGPNFAVADAEESVYILNAAGWGNRQNNAVLAAGGTVTFSDDETGVGVATSTDPNFLTNAMAARGVFISGAQDQEIEWTPMVTDAIEAGEAGITPGDEGFFPFQWNMQSMDAPLAWAQGCTGAGVRIAILDGGISSGHVDIAPNLDVGASASFVPGWAFDEDLTDFLGPPPRFRHATHVAGIAAAPDNGVGTLGVAPEATIIGVKVLNAGGGFFSWIIQGILYASDPNGGDADIINMSLAGIFGKSGGDGPLVAAMNNAVNTATRRGVLVVSAAGNNAFNFDQSYDFTIVPAESGNGIAVSATGPTDFIFGGTNYRRFASYSNSGSSLVNVAAPGGDFVTAGFPYDMVLSPGARVGTSNYYFWAAGTSMAAPAAAGVAALIKQQNPDIAVGDWKNALANTADDEGKVGVDDLYGRGFVNALNACGG